MMGRQRVYVAIVFIPLFYLMVKYLPAWVFFLFVGAGILIALQEFYGMYYDKLWRLEVLLGLSLGALTALLLSQNGAVVTPWLWTSVLIVAMLLGQLFFAKNLRTALPDGAVLVTGVLYIAVLLGHLILLRKMSGGEFLVFFVFLVSWGCDTGAYYTGKRFGQRALAPKVSPNKTVEGAIGGVIFSVATCFLAKGWFLQELSVQEALGLGLGLGIIAQLGDLAESVFKRGSGVKDSSQLIPAHGGVLDRVDSLIFTSPAFYYYLIWIKQYGRGIAV